MFVFVAFRGFAQFSGNQCQRAHSEHEKACCEDHDQTLSKICAILISCFDSFAPIEDFASLIR
jgi:hypothetical protein